MGEAAFRRHSGPIAVAEPLAAAAALAGSGEPFVLFERSGLWQAGIGAAATIRAEADRLVIEAGGRRETVRLGARPLSRFGAAVAACIEPDRPAFGWIGFPPGDGHLSACMVVPRALVDFDGRAATVSADTEEELDRAAALLDASGPPPIPTPVDVEAGGERYRGMVTDAVACISAGELQKVILSRRVPVRFPVDFPATYRLGRAAHTPARSFLLNLGSRWAAGFSPETLVEVRDGRVGTEPLAGTRAFGTAHDTALRAALLGDPKEVFEHAVSVKLAFDELTGCCAEGTVVVDDLMTVRERGSVQHLGSRVSGALGPGRTAWDALDAVFPGVTASGVPKAAARRCIAELESADRGLYAGAVLRVDPDGTMDACLTLRAIFGDGERAWLQAGAGIVRDSRPEREFRETCEKFAAVAPYVVRAR